jgi:hypothetical protein
MSLKPVKLPDVGMYRVTVVTVHLIIQGVVQMQYFVDYLMISGWVAIHLLMR